MERVIYTPAEVSKLLGVKLETAYSLIKSGSIPALRIGRNYKIPKEMFDEWLRNAASAQTKRRNEGEG